MRLGVRFVLVVGLVMACGRTDIAPRCTSSTLASPLGLAQARVELHGEYAYWSTGGGSAGPVDDLVRTPKRGGATLTVAKDVTGAFALDGARIYYAKSESSYRASLWSSDLDGTNASMIAPDIDRSAYVSIVDNTVLVASRGIIAMSKSGGSPHVVSSRHVISPIASDARYVYFAEARGSAYAIVRTSKDRDDATTLYESTMASCLRQLVLGTRRLAWVEYSCPPDRVSVVTFSMPKTGGVATIVPEMGGPIFILGDDLYGTSDGGCRTCKPHAVDVIAEDGTRLLRGSEGVEIPSLAADEQAVYAGVNTFFQGTEKKPVGALMKLCR